jgi:hypothetical protein
VVTYVPAGSVRSSIAVRLPGYLIES